MCQSELVGDLNALHYLLMVSQAHHHIIKKAPLFSGAK